MATWTLPDIDIFKPKRMEWGLRRNVLITTSTMNGSLEITELPGTRWVCTLVYDILLQAEAAKHAAFWAKLGQADLLDLWHIGQPIPFGTLRGIVSVVGAHAQGAKILTIQGQVAGQNILDGDLLATGSQPSTNLVMVTSGATLDGNARATVSIQPGLNTAVGDGTAVIWDHPRALFRMMEPEVRMMYERSIATGYTVNLVQD